MTEEHKIDAIAEKLNCYLEQDCHPNEPLSMCSGLVSRMIVSAPDKNALLAKLREIVCPGYVELSECLAKKDLTIEIAAEILKRAKEKFQEGIDENALESNGSPHNSYGKGLHSGIAYGYQDALSDLEQIITDIVGEK